MSTAPSQWRISRPKSPDGKSLIPTWEQKRQAGFRYDKIDDPDAREFLARLLSFFEEHGYGATLQTPFGTHVVKPRCKRDGYVQENSKEAK